MSSSAHPDRPVLSLAGPETIPLLQSLVTANVERLSVGDVTHAALLTPQGKVLSAFFLWRTDDGVLLDAAPGQAESLMRKLTLYKLRAAVEIEDATGSLCVWTGDEGPEGARPDPRLAAMGHRWTGEPREGGVSTYDARRVELGVPEFGYDYADAGVFPMDVNLDRLGAVDYKKGCFVGQEVASRMFRKGEVRKRSWRIEGASPLQKGAPVTAGGSTLGEVTSASGNRGIALLRVDRVAAATEEPMAGGAPVGLNPPGYLA